MSVGGTKAGMDAAGHFVEDTEEVVGEFGRHDGAFGNAVRIRVMGVMSS
jgi:hypothetical protein